MKDQYFNFDEAENIALRGNSALWATENRQDSFFRVNTNLASVPMEIGNLQRGYLTGEETRQRAIDLKNNACTGCDTKKCRLWIF